MKNLLLFVPYNPKTTTVHIRKSPFSCKNHGKTKNEEPETGPNKKPIWRNSLLWFCFKFKIALIYGGDGEVNEDLTICRGGERERKRERERERGSYKRVKRK